MIENNKIYKIFVDVLEKNKKRKLVSLWPDQTQNPIQWNLPFIFDDGKKVVIETGLNNKEFRSEWKKFWHWHDRQRRADIKEVE